MTKKDKNHKSGKHHHHHHHRERSDSNASQNPHSLFHHGDCPTPVVNQTTTVNVSVNPKGDKDDCMTSCFSGLAKCFGRGAKSAATG